MATGEEGGRGRGCTADVKPLLFCLQVRITASKIKKKEKKKEKTAKKL
jgi:hypothetical protein